MLSLQQHPIIFPPTKTTESITAESILDIIKRENLSEQQQIKLYSTMIEICPLHVQLLSNRMSLYFFHKKYEQALADVEKLIQIKPSALVCWEQGRIYLRLQQKQNALNSASKAQELAQKEGDTRLLSSLFNLKGVILADLGKDFTAAIQQYDQALKLDPNFIAALLNRARAYLELHNYLPLVEQDCSKVIQLQPRNLQALRIRATVYNRMNQAEKELQDLNKIIDIDPSTADTYLEKASILLYNQNNFKVARENIDEAVKRAQTCAFKNEFYLFWSLHLTGVCYSQMEQPEKAIQLYTAAFKEADKFLPTLHTKSLNHKRWVNGKMRFCFVRRSIAYKTIKMYDEALQDLQHALRLLENGNQNKLAKQEVMKETQQLIEEIHVERAKELQSKGGQQNYQQALKDWNEVIKINPHILQNYFQRYLLCTQMKLFDQAQQDFKQFCDMEQISFNNAKNEKISTKENESKLEVQENKQEINSNCNENNPNPTQQNSNSTTNSNQTQQNANQTQQNANQTQNNKRKLQENVSDSNKRQEIDTIQRKEIDCNEIEVIAVW